MEKVIVLDQLQASQLAAIAAKATGNEGEIANKQQKKRNNYEPLSAGHYRHRTYLLTVTTSLSTSVPPLIKSQERGKSYKDMLEHLKNLEVGFWAHLSLRFLSNPSWTRCSSEILSRLSTVS